MEGLELSTATLSVLRLHYENSAVWEGQARASFPQLPGILPAVFPALASVPFCPWVRVSRQGRCFEIRGYLHLYDNLDPCRQVT